MNIFNKISTYNILSILNTIFLNLLILIMLEKTLLVGFKKLLFVMSILKVMILLIFNQRILVVKSLDISKSLVIHGTINLILGIRDMVGIRFLLRVSNYFETEVLFQPMN